MSDEFEYQSMLEQYKGGYYNTTTDFFRGRFEEPSTVRRVEGTAVDVIAGPVEGEVFLYSTIGFGVNPSDLDYPPFELVAISAQLDDRIAETLSGIGLAARTD